MNTRGQEMTLGTIIMIVLGLLVLVFLIFGFSTGWGNLWSKITNFGGGKANIDTVVSACELACLQNAQYTFCSQPREVIFQDNKITSGSCNDLSINGQLGIKPCSTLCSEAKKACTISQAKDTDCDGVADSSPSTQKNDAPAKESEGNGESNNQETNRVIEIDSGGLA